MEADQTTVNIVDDRLPELLTTLLDIYTKSLCKYKNGSREWSIFFSLCQKFSNSDDSLKNDVYTVCT